MLNYALKVFFFDFRIIKKKLSFNWRHVLSAQSIKKSIIYSY